MPYSTAVDAHLTTAANASGISLSDEMTTQEKLALYESIMAANPAMKRLVTDAIQQKLATPADTTNQALRKLLIDAGVGTNISKASERLGITYPQMSGWLKGKTEIKMSTLQDIADQLGFKLTIKIERSQGENSAQN